MKLEITKDKILILCLLFNNFTKDRLYRRIKNKYYEIDKITDWETREFLLRKDLEKLNNENISYGEINIIKDICEITEIKFDKNNINKTIKEISKKYTIKNRIQPHPQFKKLINNLETNNYLKTKKISETRFKDRDKKFIKSKNTITIYNTTNKILEQYYDYIENNLLQLNLIPKDNFKELLINNNILFKILKINTEFIFIEYKLQNISLELIFNELTKNLANFTSTFRKLEMSQIQDKIKNYNKNEIAFIEYLTILLKEITKKKDINVRNILNGLIYEDVNYFKINNKISLF